VDTVAPAVDWISRVVFAAAFVAVGVFLIGAPRFRRKLGR
jgi:hypothetical protein